MEVLVSPQTQKLNPQTPSRKNSLIGSQRDLWLAVREGIVADVDSALALLKKSGGNVNLRNAYGLTPLHIATWRNHIPIVRRLLAAGADPDARDGESGWSSLHRALHFGHLAVASVLIQSGASITLEDSKSRTPVDLVSAPVAQVIGNEKNSVAAEVFSWGSGANYQLGTGNQHVQKLPCMVDTLHGCFVKLVSAAKFHSVAVSSHGEVYTWGFGRGGRLGHPDFDIHSGQAAVITPRQVTYGLGSRRVKAVSAAKHHTVIATEGGDVFTWGSNREGQLGYTSVDTQPTPRRVSSLKSKIVAVSAANKHTAVVSESGEVFTWGCNREGQLGYGTSNSASNYTPRLVEYLKGKVFLAVSCAKYHTLVLRDDGEVYTWGHRLVTPKRVVISRNLKKAGSAPLNFHRREHLRLTAIAAGMVYSIALAEDGALFYWVSSDCNLRCQQLYSLCGKSIVSISAGKYWAAAITSTGDVYMWDGKKGKDKLPAPTRLLGLKRATSISVGETHLLAVGSLYQPTYLPNMGGKAHKVEVKNARQELEELDEGFMFNDMEFDNVVSSVQHDIPKEREVPSLKSLCERVAAECLVEPRNAIQLLEIADSLGAESLKKYCEDIAIRNLDFILTVSSQTFASASLNILADLEKLLDSRSSEAWSFHRLPTPTAMFPVVIDSEGESEIDFLRTRDSHVKHLSTINCGDPRFGSFLQPEDELGQCVSRQVRALRKKLQQIEILQAKQSSGHALDGQQIAKLKTKSCIESSLAELGVSAEVPPQSKSSSAISSDGRANRKAEGSRKKKKKSKQRLAQVEALCGCDGIQMELNTLQVNVNEEISQSLKDKDYDAMSKVNMSGEFPKESDLVMQKNDVSIVSSKNGGPSPTAAKKKNRKGGLSMFLSGALDETPKPVVTAPIPKIEGPAWGGAKISKGSASLREIQNEQSKTQMHEHVRNSRSQVEDGSSGKSEGKILLSSFLTSKPIPVTPAQAVKHSDAERGTPPWASPEIPPHLCRPSLRDIQMQQVKKQQSLSHSPGARTSGFSVASGQGSPSDSPGTNRWFKPEVEVPSSIRSIQIEEKAMKDLRRFYSNVKVVKNQSS